MTSATRALTKPLKRAFSRVRVRLAVSFALAGVVNLVLLAVLGVQLLDQLRHLGGRDRGRDLVDERRRIVFFNHGCEALTGWSRTGKQIEGIKCFDAAHTDEFLELNHYLVGLLPYTQKTHGIFQRSVFEKLAKHPVLPSPVFINGGRGGSQNETDIAECLGDGTLGGVSLDVFEKEPLAKESPLWALRMLF